MERKREFPFSEKNFKYISELAYEKSGIVLGEHKRDMVYSRLTRRLRELKFQDYDTYCDYLENNTEQELSYFINALTTNLTSFFRENHHFDYLRETMIPELKRTNAGSKKVRIWSAGCSKGMESYSIAMTMVPAFNPSQWDMKILATDLDSNVLDIGRRAVYSAHDVEGMSEEQLKKYFERNKSTDEYRVKSHYRDCVHFKYLNLLSEWPMKQTYDIIFCRNVVIYFDYKTKCELFEKFANLLKPNGLLVIGHSESIQNISKRFSSVGRTIFRKVS